MPYKASSPGGGATRTSRGQAHPTATCAHDTRDTQQTTRAQFRGFLRHAVHCVLAFSISPTIAEALCAVFVRPQRPSCSMAPRWHSESAPQAPPHALLAPLRRLEEDRPAPRFATAEHGLAHLRLVGTAHLREGWQHRARPDIVLELDVHTAPAARAELRRGGGQSSGTWDVVVSRTGRSGGRGS